MDDVIKSVKAYLYDRTASPLFGSFLLAWLAWNYRIIFVFFTGGSAQEKLEALDLVFSRFDFIPYVPAEIVNIIFMPAVITLFYIFCYPKLAKPVFEHSLKKQKELAEIKQQQENTRLLSVEEYISSSAKQKTSLRQRSHITREK